MSDPVAPWLAAQAERNAARTNARSAARTNTTNFLLNLASRGAALPAHLPGLPVPANVAGRESTFLPYYFNDQERALADEARRVFDETGRAGGTPEQQIAAAREVVNQFMPALQQGGETVRGIFDNTLTGERVAEAQPVFAARSNLATARKNAGLDALQETLNQIKAIQGRAGYTGDSLANQRLRADVTRRVYGDAAVDTSAADLQNATDLQAIMESGRRLKLSSLSLPTAQAQNILNLQEQPLETVATRFNRRLQPFGFFRMGQNQFNVAPLPQVNPIPGFAGIAATTAGNSLRDFASAYARGAFRPTTTTPTTPVSTSVGTYPQGSIYDTPSMYGNYDTYGAGTDIYGGAIDVGSGITADEIIGSGGI